ncbi:MAG: response regulator [Deltaproteobacteria bacterium]|jgi:CheY-like chemotaxis protein|nr:response regulator [Deltaproteobacteria bacterium]
MSGPQEPTQPKVLVIDDDALTHRVLEAVLKKGGYKCVSAYRGEEGLELARAHKPHLIILDIMMPGLNGFEVMKYLKASPSTSAIPVIFLTGQVHQEGKTHAKDLGAVDYLEKPFERQELLNRVDSYVNARRREKSLAYYNDRLTQVAMEALALLTNNSGEPSLEPDPPPDESLTQLLAKINDARDKLEILIRKWPDLEKNFRAQSQDLGFPLTLSDLRDNLGEIRDLADHLKDLSGWPPS